MILTRHISTAAAFLLLSGAVVSCNTSGCLDNQSAIPLADFYSSGGGAVSIDSMRVAGVDAPADSALATGNSPISRIYLPLRSDHSSTAFAFTYLQKQLSGISDTLFLTYVSAPRFISEECGAVYEYTITGCRHTSHVLDSVAILDPLITNVDATRIRLFFRTIEAPEETPVTPPLEEGGADE